MHSRAWLERRSVVMAVAFDEMNGPGGDLRPAYQELSRWLKETPPDALEYRRQEAELLFRRIGITFAVYGDAEAQERLIPFDVIPRIMSAREWTVLEKGLKQRVRALNMFLRDIYHGRDILRANIIPDDLIFQNPVFRPEMNGQDVPHDVYVHIAGIDIVRVNPHDFFVLEDNARTPSGVSYMLENREIMMRLFPDLFARHRVAPVENYPDELLAALRSVAPLTSKAEPTVALLTPGIYNSAYYEHSFLADKLGVELVEGRDLIVKNLTNVVAKRVHGPGGYGMLFGPAATREQIEAFRAKLMKEPEGFIAQPTLALSTCPTCTESGLAPRHVDLRPFVLTGKDHVTIVPGGLTRVALKQGSLVVNSSQGGGTKDTWILDE